MFLGISKRLSNKHRKTVQAVFERPTRSDLPWRDVEALFRALGAELKEGRGSRVGVELNGQEAVFHRPHPRPAMSKGSVEAVRDFLARVGMDNLWNTAATPPDR